MTDKSVEIDDKYNHDITKISNYMRIEIFLLLNFLNYLRKNKSRQTYTTSGIIFINKYLKNFFKLLKEIFHDLNTWNVFYEF